MKEKDISQNELYDDGEVVAGIIAVDKRIVYCVGRYFYPFGQEAEVYPRRGAFTIAREGHAVGVEGFFGNFSRVAKSRRRRAEIHRGIFVVVHIPRKYKRKVGRSGSLFE